MIRNLIFIGFVLLAVIILLLLLKEYGFFEPEDNSNKHYHKR